MIEDPIVAEIRRNREEHAKRFNYDLQLIIDDIRREQGKHAGKIVNLPPKRYLKPNDLGEG